MGALQANAEAQSLRLQQQQQQTPAAEEQLRMALEVLAAETTTMGPVTTDLMSALGVDAADEEACVANVRKPLDGAVWQVAGKRSVGYQSRY